MWRISHFQSIHSLGFLTCTTLEVPALSFGNRYDGLKPTITVPGRHKAKRQVSYWFLDVASCPVPGKWLLQNGHGGCATCILAPAQEHIADKLPVNTRSRLGLWGTCCRRNWRASYWTDKARQKTYWWKGRKKSVFRVQFLGQAFNRAAVIYSLKIRYSPVSWHCY